MRVAAIIPARGGSKRLPGKNLAPVGGVPMLVRSIRTALGAGIERVYVSTDADDIARAAEVEGALVVRRPSELATDLADTESVMVHWWRGLSVLERPQVIALMQCTSPLVHSRHLREALELLSKSGADSVAAVRAQPHGAFAGRAYPRETGSARWVQFRPFGPIATSRPRTQDARKVIEEAGAFWLTTKDAWLMTGSRMGGTVAAYELPQLCAVDVDTPEDLAVANALCDLAREVS